MKSASTYPLQTNQAYWPLRASKFGKSASNSTQKRVSTQISNLLRMLVSQLVGGDGPLVWQTRDVAGRAVWSAEDRVSGKSIRGVSEAELRIWLEARYQF
jgi:hypothetical protein